jgi:hypothetical protein
MDIDLVVRAQDGDEIAFARLTDSVYGRMQQLSHRILRDPELARKTAQEAALYLWKHREEFRASSLSCEEAIERALAVDGGPVVINETSDNPGGGTPGDGTHLLRAMVEAKLDDACFGFIVDPAAAEAAHRAGVGATVELELGGKYDDLHGAPLTRRGEASEELRDLLERALRGRQPDPLGWVGGDLLEPLQGERQMSPPLGGGHGVDLVDDDRLDAGEGLARRRREHQVEGLRGRDEQVRRTPDELLSLVGGCVPGAHPHRRRGERLIETVGGEFDALQRGPQILLDVERQRPEWRDVEDPRAALTIGHLG